MAKHSDVRQEAERLARLIAEEIGSADDYCCRYGQGWSIKDLREIACRHAASELSAVYARARREALEQAKQHMRERHKIHCAVTEEGEEPDYGF